MIRKSIAALLLTFAAGGQVSAVNLAVEKSFGSRLRAATDARDAENPVFDEALKARDYDALEMLGQVGGDACRKLIPYFSREDGPARLAAFKGAAYCQDKALAPALLAAQAPADDATYAAYMAALGFSGGQAALESLTTEVNAIAPEDRGPRATAALYGLMQSIVYDHMDAQHLSALDFPHVLALATSGDRGIAAGYLLTRFQGVRQVLERTAVEAAIAKADDTVKPLLARVLGRMGDEAAPALIALAGSKVRALRYEAVRALGMLTDAKSLGFLLEMAGKGDDFIRQIALTALSSRSGEDKAVTALLVKTVDDPNPWLKATALEGVAAFDAVTANRTAALWLDAQDYYLAYKAMGILTHSDDGKALLKEYADAHTGTVRGHDAAVWLDPSIEVDVTPRETPSDRSLASYRGRKLVLETTRGTICIAFEDQTPYAANNFMRLADAGKMDHMLWQRVIPDFVAQDGAVEDPEINAWGSIREEWFVSDHRPGTVGLATAGKDTGGTQFFINTSYNLHLNGRYTMFGHVAKGMDAAYALEEGDVITRAYTVAPTDSHCQ